MKKRTKKNPISHVTVSRKYRKVIMNQKRKIMMEDT